MSTLWVEHPGFSDRAPYPPRCVLLFHRGGGEWIRDVAKRTLLQGLSLQGIISKALIKADSACVDTGSLRKKQINAIMLVEVGLACLALLFAV